MANICWTKHDTDNQARALESPKGLLRCCKISWTLVHKRLKTGPEVLPTLTIYAIASGGLKWQYIAIIATFSSLFIYLGLFITTQQKDQRPLTLQMVDYAYLYKREAARNKPVVWTGWHCYIVVIRRYHHNDGDIIMGNILEWHSHCSLRGTRLQLQATSKICSSPQQLYHCFMLIYAKGCSKTFVLYACHQRRLGQKFSLFQAIELFGV